MSLIDQALKKTQSSLKQQKTETTSQSEPIASSVRTPTLKYPPRRNPLQQKRHVTRHIEWPGFNKYLVYSLLGLFFLTAGAYLIHLNYASIAQRYKNFYEGMYFSLTHSKATPIILPPPAATATVTVVPEKSLSLDGTMEVNHERVALINGHLYHKGETVGGYRIIQVRYNHVSLQNINTQQSLILTPTLAQ